MQHTQTLNFICLRRRYRYQICHVQIRQRIIMGSMWVCSGTRQATWCCRFCAGLLVCFCSHQLSTVCSPPVAPSHVSSHARGLARFASSLCIELAVPFVHLCVCSTTSAGAAGGTWTTCGSCGSRRGLLCWSCWHVPSCGAFVGPAPTSSCVGLSCDTILITVLYGTCGAKRACKHD